MQLLSRDILQAATTIAKTTQTIIGSELNVSGADYITLFLEYTKGDETGCLVQAHMLQATGGTEHQDQSWSAAAGAKTHTVNEYTMATAVPHYIIYDVRGIEFIKFTQGGSDNDGTPTGTLAASYTMKK